MASWRPKPILVAAQLSMVNETSAIDFSQPHYLAYIFQQAILILQTFLKLVIYYLQYAFVKSHRSLI